MSPQNKLFNKAGPLLRQHVKFVPFLNDLFSNFWIGRYGPKEWPARSPELTPSDIFP